MFLLLGQRLLTLRFLPACSPEIRGNPHLLIKYHSGFFVDGKFLCCQQSCKAAPGCTLWEACNVTLLLGWTPGGQCPLANPPHARTQDVPDWLASWVSSLEHAIWQMKSYSRINWVMFLKITTTLTSAIHSCHEKYFLNWNHKSVKEPFPPIFLPKINPKWVESGEHVTMVQRLKS